MAPLLLVAVAALSAPPDFLRASRGAQVTDLLAAPHVPSRERTLDVTGDGRPERLVLVGRPGPDGVLFPVGLLVLAERPGRLSVLAARTLGLNPAYDAQFASGLPVDLDGDGVAEIAVDERVVGPDLAISGTTFWRLSNQALEPAYHLQRRVVMGTTIEERAMSVRAPGHIVEQRAVNRPATPPDTVQVSLRFDPRTGRFFPDLTVPLRP